MHWIALQLQPDAGGVSPEGGVLADEQALVDPLTALGWWALQFTPKVARVARGADPGQDMLVMEVLASERLFGGRKQLLQHIFKENRPPVPVNYARGATSLIAIARLQMPPCQPDELPLTTLAAAQPHLPTLARIGCTGWGQVRALPRGGVVRRFGADLLDALDRAYGLKPELYPWLVLPEVFAAQLELSAQVETAPALMFGARRLLNQLQVWLQMRHCGVLAFELGWTMDARRNTATTGQRVIRTAEPTLDVAHLQRLLAENLARITLPAPVLYLQLRTLEVQKLAGRSSSLLPDEQLAGDSLHQMLERLSARLGPDNVLHCQARADHRPEHMQVWSGTPDATQFIANYVHATGTSDPNRLKKMKNRPLQAADALYPTWLLSAPLKLALQGQVPLYQGPLTLLSGPQRLEAGWWATQGSGESCALRDYFLARSEHMGLLWIYRERLGGQGTPNSPTLLSADWFLHGVFG